MIIYMLIFIYSISNIYLIKKRENKLPNDIFSFLTLWIIFFGKTNDPDYLNYLARFNNLEKNYNEFLLIKSMEKLKILCNNFNFYLCIMCFFCLILIFYTIYSLSKVRSLVYFLYIIYPYFLDVIQLKNFIAESIFIFSLGILIRKRSILLSFLIYIFSLGFHISNIFYFPYFFIKKLREKNMYILVVNTIIIFFVIYAYILLCNNITTIKKILFFIDVSRQNYYLSNLSKLGWIIPIFIQITNIIIIKYCLKKDREKMGSYDKFLTFSFIFLGLYFFNETFMRLFRNVSIINYIVYSNYYFSLKKSKNIFLFFIISYTSIISFYYIDFKNIVLLIIQSNMFL